MSVENTHSTACTPPCGVLLPQRVRSLEMRASFADVMGGEHDERHREIDDTISRLTQQNEQLIAGQQAIMEALGAIAANDLSIRDALGAMNEQIAGLLHRVGVTVNPSSTQVQHDIVMAQQSEGVSAYQ